MLIRLVDRLFKGQRLIWPQVIRALYEGCDSLRSRTRAMLIGDEAMPAIAMIITAQLADASDTERTQRVFLDHRDRCLRDEPGTLVFEVLVPDEGVGKFMAYEVYADETALAAHMEGASFTQTMAELEGVKLEFSITRGVRLD
jgi:quinol monooxygenase YgiN